MTTVIRGHDLEALVVGVTLLGSGGGGDSRAFGRILQRRLGSGDLKLLDASDVPDGYLTPVGVVGATSVLTEKLPSGSEFSAAVQAVSRWTGHAVSGLSAESAYAAAASCSRSRSMRSGAATRCWCSLYRGRSGGGTATASPTSAHEPSASPASRYCWRHRDRSGDIVTRVAAA
jgi:uncharacterized protein DUF917